MVLPCLQSLLDLCAIRLAYLMWTRRDVANKCFIDHIIQDLETVVLEDAKKLPLPEKLKPFVLKYLKPTREHLLSLLSSWLSKLPSDTPQKWLIGDTLFDCLVLNADGLINQRRTAQTVLRTKVLHNVAAFRLACINFLEEEVLKLWILVKEYFLRKIVLESDQPKEFRLFTYRNSFCRTPSILPHSFETSYASTTEPEEVLFWIAHCLSKENAIDMREVPHFMESGKDWYESSLLDAAFSGNVACFDYFKNFCERKFEHDHAGMIKTIFKSERKKCHHPSFIFHFMLLNLKQKRELFMEFPEDMVAQFLQWPLSETFLQNTEEVWNLIPNNYKVWTLAAIYNILIWENILLHSSTFGFYLTINIHSVTFCIEHLLGIWFALWNVSSDSDKSTFLDGYVFQDFEDLEDYDEDDEFPSKFETSGLKQKLLRLLLSNGEALLELYQRETLQESLKSIFAKYMPSGLRDIDGNYISFFETKTLPLRILHKEKLITFSEMMRYQPSFVRGSFLYYIKTVLFSSFRSGLTFFHY